MDKRICRVSKKIGELLVTQMSNELYNNHLYASMAVYFSLEGITDLEKYYRKRAEEEHLHFSWIYDYLCEVDYDFIVPPVKEITEKWENEIDPFKLTVLAEIKTSDDIDKIYFDAIEEKDTHTKIWLESRLIPEQKEEETTSRTALDIINLDDSPILIRAKNIKKLLNY